MSTPTNAPEGAKFIIIAVSVTKAIMVKSSGGRSTVNSSSATTTATTNFDDRSDLTTVIADDQSGGAVVLANDLTDEQVCNLTYDLANDLRLSDRRPCRYSARKLSHEAKPSQPNV